MAENGDWILKIISGPHQGVEEMLPEGRLLVGTGPDCGIVLHDVLIAPQHFALTRKGNTVTVEALGGRTYCGGRRVTAPTAVPAFAFVTAGTTHVVLGPAAGTWPLLSSADAPELEKDPPPAPAVPPTPSAAPAAGAATIAPAAGATTPASPPGARAPADPTPQQRRRAWWMAAFGGFLLVVWLVLWLLFRPAPSEPSRPGPRARTERVLDSIPGANRVRIEERGNLLALSGYVDSDAAHRDLIAALRAEVPEASLRLWSTPRMVETARELLASRKLNLTLKPSENGELTIAGTAPSAAEWTVVRQLLLAEVPGLQKIHDEVTVAKEPEKVPKAPAEPAVPPDLALTVIALQTSPEAPAWVRLANGTVYFTGASFQGVATFTGLESAKARFEHAGGATLFGLGEHLGVLLASKSVPDDARPSVPNRAELAPAPSAPPSPAPSTSPASAPTQTMHRPEAKPGATDPTPVLASQPAPGAATPAPATTATPEATAPAAAAAPAAAQPVTNSPSPGTEATSASPGSAATEVSPEESTPPPEAAALMPAPDSTAPAWAPETEMPGTPSPADVLPAEATDAAAAQISDSTETSPAEAPCFPVEPTAGPSSGSEPTAMTASAAIAPESPVAPTTHWSTDATARPEGGPEAGEEEIRVIREALAAWEAGDLAAGRRALTLLARLLPPPPAATVVRSETTPRAIALQHGWGGPMP